MRPLDADGWTIFQRSPESIVYYVSNSEGDDDNDGLSEDHPVKTIVAGVAKLRDDSPDWLLLKRSDKYVGEGVGNNIQTVFGKSGLSFDKPMVIGAYGEGDRPLMLSAIDQPGLLAVSAIKHLAILDLDFYSFGRSVDETTHCLIFRKGEDIHIEGCRIYGYRQGVSASNINGLAIRRNAICQGYSQGIFTSNCNGLSVEENFLDTNGWREGVKKQSTRTHGMYITAACGPAILRDNIVVRSSATGIQARSGGVVENNLLIRNPIGLQFGLTLGTSPKPEGVSGRVAGNFVLEANDIGTSRRRMGMIFANINADGLVVENNYVGQPLGPKGFGYQVGVGNGIGVYKIDFRGNIGDCENSFQVSVSRNEMLTVEPYLGTITAEQNYFASPTYVLSCWSFVDNYAIDFSKLKFSTNHYRCPSKMPVEMVVLLDGENKRQNKTAEQWKELTGDDSEFDAEPKFSDRYRGIDDYQLTIDPEADFFTRAGEQRRGAWDTRYTADAALKFLREGLYPLDADGPDRRQAVRRITPDRRKT